MHPAAYQFVETVLAAHPPRRSGYVLEIGSYDVNGSVRPLLAGLHYRGLDIRPGPSVDEVSDCADYDGNAAFDLVVSTEAMEHMPDPATLIACAARALKPGGMLILTMAGPRRHHHGIDGDALRDGEHYANITPEQLQVMLDGWQDVQITHNTDAHDLYATAIKPEDA